VENWDFLNFSAPPSGKTTSPRLKAIITTEETSLASL